VIDASKLAVVGLAEVVAHLPGIYREYRKLIASAERQRPDAAILIDSQAFHARVAASLHKLGIPVFQLIAPQAWAWRESRVIPMRRNVTGLLCIFPFEEAWFRERGVRATYIGHPLAARIAPRQSRVEFRKEIRVAESSPLIALLPGSRKGEVRRHLPLVRGAFERLRARFPDARFVLGTTESMGARFFVNQLGASSIQPIVLVERTWDLLAHADLAIAASGTVTMEAALLGTPLVSFYRVSELSWRAGRWLVRAPHFTMANLIAGERIVPELIQHEATGERIAAAAGELLADPAARARQRQALARVADSLRGSHDPMEKAAGIIEEHLIQRQHTHP
jgi:lipid-A-disaccharide synthase